MQKRAILATVMKLLSFGDHDGISIAREGCGRDVVV